MNADYWPVSLVQPLCGVVKSFLLVPCSTLYSSVLLDGQIVRHDRIRTSTPGGLSGVWPVTGGPWDGLVRLCTVRYGTVPSVSRLSNLLYGMNSSRCIDISIIIQVLYWQNPYPVSILLCTYLYIRVRRKERLCSPGFGGACARALTRLTVQSITILVQLRCSGRIIMFQQY